MASMSPLRALAAGLVRTRVAGRADNLEAAS